MDLRALSGPVSLLTLLFVGGSASINGCAVPPAAIDAEGARGGAPPSDDPVADGVDGGAGGADVTCRDGQVAVGGACEDIDECALDLDDCAPDETCVNVDGSFRCVLAQEEQDEADPPGPPATGALSIFVVDIGQGDATVVLGPTIAGRRKALVMDAGNRHPDGGRIVGDLLTQLGITQLDYVVLSHFDGDHIGGFVTVSGSTSLLWQSEQCDATPWFPTHSIYDQGTDTNQTVSSTQWRTCVPAIAAARTVEHHAVEGGALIGTELDLGDGYRATIVAGDGYVIDTTARVSSVNTPNERSIALLVSHDDGFDFLVTGDLIGRSAGSENARVEGALGTALAARGVDVEVLRTGHHGAANASDPDFLNAIAAEVAIISTGDDQSSSYQHPRCASYESLSAANVGLVLQTELGNSDCAGNPPLSPVVVNGTIRIEVFGSEYTISNHGVVSPANGEATLEIDHACTVTNGC